jgi:protein phosphatase
MIQIPPAALVLLIGASGSGKSTFASQHFDAGAVVSSDQVRGVVSGDEADQRATAAAFEQLYRWLDGRLAAGVLAVVDATNTDWMGRAELIRRARVHGRPVIAIVFDLDLDLCLARSAARPRAVRASVIRRQHEQLRHDRDRLDLEGFSAVHVLGSAAEVDRVAVDVRLAV